VAGLEGRVGVSAHAIVSFGTLAHLRRARPLIAGGPGPRVPFVLPGAPGVDGRRQTPVLPPPRPALSPFAPATFAYPFTVDSDSVLHHDPLEHMLRSMTD